MGPAHQQWSAAVIPRVALQERSAEWGLTEEVVEKDYVLGWLLWGIGSASPLRNHWIFKGALSDMFRIV